MTIACMKTYSLENEHIRENVFNSDEKQLRMKASPTSFLPASQGRAWLEYDLPQQLTTVKACAGQIEIMSLLHGSI